MATNGKLLEPTAEIWQEALEWVFVEYADVWAKLAALDEARAMSKPIVPEVLDDQCTL